MKRLIFMMSMIVGLTTQVLAQSSFPCDITSSGVQLRNSSGAPLANLFATGSGVVNFVLSNQGVGQTNGDACSYAIGKVKVTVSFPTAAFSSYYFTFGGGSNTFSTPKYDWVFTPSTGALVGTNSAPISTGFSGAEIVNVPILGVAAGSSILPVSMQIIQSASGDNTNNNAFELPITVLAGSGGVLPVTINSIDAVSNKCNAQIKWSTSNETNLKKFEVEVSTNGINFEKAGAFNPSASSAGNYEFNTTQGTGKGYYRLKIIDKDGSISYSKIVTVNTSCSDKIVKLFPNPVKLDQLLNVNLTGYEGAVKADLYSATGQFVKSYILKNGANNLSVENLAQGFYTLRVMENGSITESFKLNVLK